MKDKDTTPVPEYRVDEPAAAWEKFQTVAHKTLTEPKLTKPAALIECQPVLKNERTKE
jgi:hypothetical protein